MFIDTLVRMKNVKMYLTIEKFYTVKEAAICAGIAHQHGTRLVRRWRNAGLIERKGSLHGKRYFYTERGRQMRIKLIPLTTMNEENNGR